MTPGFPKLWFLIMFCLSPVQINETESRLQNTWRRGGSRISRSTMLLQRPMRSLTHTARCRRYIYSPECRGIMSKRSTIQLPQRKTVDFGKNIFLRKKSSDNTEQGNSQNNEDIIRRYKKPCYNKSGFIRIHKVQILQQN